LVINGIAANVTWCEARYATQIEFTLEASRHSGGDLFASHAQLITVKVNGCIAAGAGIKQQTSMTRTNGYESQPPLTTEVRLFIFGKTRRAVLYSVHPPNTVVDAERHDPSGVS
jgi:hypothetical protein